MAYAVNTMETLQMEGIENAKLGELKAIMDHRHYGYRAHELRNLGGPQNKKKKRNKGRNN